MISPLHQSLGMVSAFQILWNRSYYQSVAKRISGFSTSAVILSIPGALLFFRLLITFRILFFVGREQSMFSLSPKTCALPARSAGSGHGLLRTSLSCHLCSCTFILDHDSLRVFIFHCITFSLGYSREVPCYSVQLTLLPSPPNCSSFRVGG